MEKIRYEIDPYNRLVMEGFGPEGSLPRFRKVIDGHFSLDKDNDLVYLVKAPLSQDDSGPTQMRLKGQWSLTEDHDLRLVLDKQCRETFGDKITLQGEILDAAGDSLLFALTSSAGDGQSTRVLNLRGVWKADGNNRLSFYVTRESGRRDMLVFNAAWEIDDRHHIIYRYEKSDLLNKKKSVRTITFHGHWDIKDALRVSYVLSGSDRSVFDFIVGAGVFKDGYVAYELGIKLTGRERPLEKKIVLYGKWSLKKDAGLVFEIEYGSRKTCAVIFGADIRLTDRDTVSFSLKNDIENKDIGIMLELSRKIFEGDGEAFMRILKTGREVAIYAGGAWRW